MNLKKIQEFVERRFGKKAAALVGLVSVALMPSAGDLEFSGILELVQEHIPSANPAQIALGCLIVGVIYWGRGARPPEEVKTKNLDPEPADASDAKRRVQDVVIRDRVEQGYADTAQPLRIDLLRADLYRDEGEVRDQQGRHVIYPDSEGHKTAGIGHLLTIRDAEYDWPTGTPVDNERVLQWFKQDTAQAISDASLLLPDFDSHPETVRRALVNMAFNLGHKRLSGFTNTLWLLRSRRYGEAADEALDSKWSRQVGDRAQRIAGMFRSAAPDIPFA